jgi:hypothetical protein
VQEEEVNRYTFVVQVHPEGISTLENLSTSERVRIDEITAVGTQIERWLDDLELSRPRSVPAPTESVRESAP